MTIPSGAVIPFAIWYDGGSLASALGPVADLAMVGVLVALIALVATIVYRPRERGSVMPMPTRAPQKAPTVSRPAA